MKTKKYHAAAPGFGLPEDKVQPSPKSLDVYRNTASSPAFGSSMEGFQGKRKTKWDLKLQRCAEEVQNQLEFLHIYTTG